MSRTNGGTNETGARGLDTGGRTVRVDSLKFDGRLHRSWPARLVVRDGPLLVLEGVFETEVRHPLLGRIPAGTLSTEFYWTDRWYSVFRFREAAGGLRNYYCNVNRPSLVEEELITFVDLDFDVLVAPDLSYSILDAEEFETNTARYGYPADFRTGAVGALSELISLIRGRRFPFGVGAPPGAAAAGEGEGR